MKRILLAFFFFSLQLAYCQPPPNSVILPLTLSPAERARLNTLVNEILANDKELNAKLGDITAQERVGEHNLAIVQVKLDKDDAKIFQLTAEEAIQRKWKWRYLGIALVEGLALVAIAYIKLKP